jgi:hypothetical protein
MPVRMAVRAPVKPETNSEKGKQSWKVESASYAMEARLLLLLLFWMTQQQTISQLLQLV